MISILYPIILEMSAKAMRPLVEQIPDHISVDYFSIRPELCIDSMFLNSLMLLSDLDKHLSPCAFFDCLERVKGEICYDIDEYYHSLGVERAFKIDSENIFAIVCFLLCRLKPKLREIYAALSLLTAVHGDEMTGEMGAGEYMLTTLNAAFELLKT